MIRTEFDKDGVTVVAISSGGQRDDPKLSDHVLEWALNTWAGGYVCGLLLGGALGVFCFALWRA